MRNCGSLSEEESNCCCGSGKDAVEEEAAHEAKSPARWQVLAATRQVTVEKIRHYRAIALICRQQAVLHPEASWQWLADAERYEHLVDVEIAAHFRECNESLELDAKRAAA